MVLPTPQIRPTGLDARKVVASASPITEKPRGFSKSEAILARNLLKERPIDTVMPISFSMRLLQAGERQRRRPVVQPLGAGHVHEGFVDRQRLDQRGERLHQLAHLAPDAAVFLEVRADRPPRPGRLPAP